METPPDPHAARPGARGSAHDATSVLDTYPETVVPWPSVLSTCKVPPIAASRSAIRAGRG